MGANAPDPVAAETNLEPVYVPISRFRCTGCRSPLVTFCKPGSDVVPTSFACLRCRAAGLA